MRALARAAATRIAARHLLWLPVSVGALLLASTAVAAWRVRRACRFVAQSPLGHLGQGTVTDHTASPAALGHLLVVGDSTGVGTGASSQSASLIGRIALQHPQLRITNRARNGARFCDIIDQLHGPPGGPGRFDVVLILCGANDVLRLTSGRPLRDHLRQALRLAREAAETVILMPAGNVGNTPLFLPPWSWLMTRRSRLLHGMIREFAESGEIIYVNGYKERKEDPFVVEAGRLNAEDGLHPSDEGYALWFSELERQAGLSSLLGVRLPPEHGGSGLDRHL